MTTFTNATSKNLKKLEIFVPVVARVHGEHHPEFHDVHQLFDGIVSKIQGTGPQVPDLTTEFSRLRELTDHYAVPGDVCESYEAVYVMLSELDEAYHELNQ